MLSVDMLSAILINGDFSPSINYKFVTEFIQSSLRASKFSNLCIKISKMF
jgi:hypothetical protein